MQIGMCTYKDKGGGCDDDAEINPGQMIHLWERGRDDVLHRERGEEAGDDVVIPGLDLVRAEMERRQREYIEHVQWEKCLPEVIAGHP